MMEKPTLSPDFTMEDLWKLREYNSLRRLHMTTEELVADIEKGASYAQQQIDKLRREKASQPA